MIIKIINKTRNNKALERYLQSKKVHLGKNFKSNQVHFETNFNNNAERNIPFRQNEFSFFSQSSNSSIPYNSLSQRTDI